MTRKELIKQIKATGKDKIKHYGILGDMIACGLYPEKEELTDKGWQTKYYGVSYWYNGRVDNDIIDRANITKRAFIYILRLSLPFSAPQKIIERIVDVYRVEGGLKSKEYKMREFCPAVRELVRAGTKLASKIRNEEKEKMTTDLVYCLGMFLQFSHTYRFWFQDIFGILKLGRLNKSVLGELIRVRREFMRRLKIGFGGRKKIVFLWWILIGLAIFKSKEIKQFVNELDLDKVKMDESDRYFNLRRTSYDFGGTNLTDRLSKAMQIDRERGNIILSESVEAGVVEF